MMVWTPAAPKPGDASVVVTVPDRPSLMADLRAALEAGRGITVATLNLDHVVKLRRDPAFARAYARHTHVSADGRPVVWLSRLAGQRVELVTGADLLDPLMALAAEEGAPVAFVGSTEAVLGAAAERLTQRHPGLDVALCLSPSTPFDPEGAEADAVLDRLAEAGARIVVLALGAPRQEILAARAAERLPAASFFSLGASLDFVVGHQRRAPSWMRALALEWLWRLLSNPARLGRRYAESFAVLPGLTFRALSRRRRGPAA